MGIPGQAGLKIYCSPVELSVLCPSALGIGHGLVDGLGFRPILTARGVVALVNEVAGLGVDLVPVRRAFADRHEKYGRAAAGGIVHAFLELNAFLSDDSGVGDDVVGLHVVTELIITALMR